MKEIEVKVLEINQQEIIKRLESLGAKRILSNALIEDCRFDFRDNLLKKKKELLRLRKIEKDAYLTYKNNYSVQNNVRNQDEFETKVGDSEQMKNILLGLGLQVKSIRQKRRTSYLYQDIRIEIYNFPKIPVFLPNRPRRRFCCGARWRIFPPAVFLQREELPGRVRQDGRCR